MPPPLLARRPAVVSIAETGTDIARLPTATDPAWWAGRRPAPANA
ncbi:hypothetical protein [Streptomyces sp. A30]